MSVFTLEDFSLDTASVAASPTRDADPMQGYDSGYQAGWDDAMSGAEQGRNHISAEFGRNLLELGFTFQEARAQVSASLRPVLDAMISQVLPTSATQGLCEHIWAIVEPLVEDLNTPRLVLRCAAEDEEVLTSLLDGTAALPVDLTPEPSLLRGQVSFKLGPTTHEVDMDGLIARIADMVDAQFGAQSQATLDGYVHG